MSLSVYLVPIKKSPTTRFLHCVRPSLLQAEYGLANT